MANRIEWAHVSAPTETMTPLDLYATEPDSRLLDPEMGPWGAMILTGDASVAIYADTPMDLLEWLEQRSSEVRAQIHRELSRHRPTYTVEHTGLDDNGESGQAVVLHTSTDRTAALWCYLEAARDLGYDDILELVETPTGEAGRRILAREDDSADSGDADE